MSDQAKRSWREPPETEAVLALGSFVLFAIITLSVLFNRVPAENEKYAMLMLGALIGINKDTFGRYFQATKGAQEQRKESAAAIQTLADTATAAIASNTTTANAPGTTTVTASPDVDISVRQADDEGSPEEDPTLYPGPR